MIQNQTFPIVLVSPVRARLMLWGMFCFICGLFLSCQPDHATDTEEFPDPPQLAEIQSALLLSQGQPFAPEQLIKALPPLFGGFIERKDKLKDFLGQELGFSQASAVYLMQDRHYLSISLSDYVADSSGYIHLYEQYENVHEHHMGNKVAPLRENCFAWQWRDPQAGVCYLESGAFHRFHLIMRSDLPEAVSVLQEAFKRISWDQLQEMSQS